MTKSIPTGPAASPEDVQAGPRRGSDASQYQRSDRSRVHHKRFICACGTDWMTVLPDINTCQVCYQRSQPDISDWMKFA